MPAVKRAKTSFAAGELAPELLGRGDLRAFENGARRLRNVFIQPTGGVTRRSGLRFVDMAEGAGRLIAFGAAVFCFATMYRIARLHDPSGALWGLWTVGT